MPIYEHGYQTWEGERRGPFLRWLAIPKFAYLEFFKLRVFIGLLSVAWIPLVLSLMYIYVLSNEQFLKAMNFSRAALPEINSVYFMVMIDMQIVICLIMAFLLGAGLISKDLQHSALVLYFSKPISRWEYFMGKFFSLFSLFIALTWLQPMIAFVMQTAVAPEYSKWHTDFWSDYYWIAGSITVFSVVVSLMISLMILAASSLTKNARYAGSAMVIYLIGTTIVSGMMAEILRSQSFRAISPLFSAAILGAHLFGAGGDKGFGAGLAWASVLGNCLLCAGILRWQLERMARYGR